ncbi:riboflavin synthase subunit alpha [Oceanicoccus sagamiensis]|uniref:Riboflavin synthase n=1 Tax=Oceanicoccus sagamiensis TaxID=716816 RepID=A0A1X9N980_9GAMM|nr:riboflavin synthase subunit alpha [Oceanicoccus sagamiensis]ARN73741.1 riboflavin synthase [Oceanicoccus sagamiensis]
MFTGIVQGSFPLLKVERKPGLHSFTIELPAPLREDLAIGASVAVDGVCLTVTAIEQAKVYFDIMQQTLSLTTLGELNSGDVVNIERSAKQGVEIGGHVISGHVDNTAEVVAIEQPENNRFITYRAPAEKMKYIFEKGFVGLNGCSLTVAAVDRDEHTLTVCYIPETLRVTTHGAKVIGDKINFEIDRQTQAIVDTVENFLVANPEMTNQGR